MKEILLDVLVDKLYDYLQSKSLTFKKIKFANADEYHLCNKNDAEAMSVDKQFLTDYFADYFYHVLRANKEVFPIIFHEVLEEKPHVLFTQLSSLPTFNNNKPGLDSNFYSYENIFTKNDFVTYLINHKDKNTVCANCYLFIRLLDEIHTKFSTHPQYLEIIKHNFKIHAGLIKKRTGNIIKVRSWAIKNLNDIDFLNQYLTIKNDNPLFVDFGFKTSLKFLDLKVIQANYLITQAQGITTYHNLLKSLVTILNSDMAKKQLALEKVEGNFIFDKNHYQLTFFSKEELDSISIEKSIDILLKAICDYFNLNDNKPEDFTNTVFKVFQYHNLNNKLVPLGKKIGKTKKI